MYNYEIILIYTFRLYMNKNKPKKDSRVSNAFALLIVIGLGIYIFGRQQPENTTIDGAVVITPTATLVANETTVSPSFTTTPMADETTTGFTPLSEEDALTKMLPGIKIVTRVERVGTDYWAVVKTFPNFNKKSFAQQIFVAAGTINPLIDRFAVKIDDDSSDPLWHVFDGTTGNWMEQIDAPTWVVP
jgi:hypothetical protein